MSGVHNAYWECWLWRDVDTVCGVGGTVGGTIRIVGILVLVLASGDSGHFNVSRSGLLTTTTTSYDISLSIPI